MSVRTGTLTVRVLYATSTYLLQYVTLQQIYSMSKEEIFSHVKYIVKWQYAFIDNKMNEHI